jgi:hypothetical protein
LRWPYAVLKERLNAGECKVSALALYVSITQSAIANKTSTLTSQRALLRQHLRKETAMLNLTKTTHDDVELLSFIAHPLANMFPMIEGNAFEELKRDIAAQGILEPIRLYQGMILDGRNRYAAAKACGHEFSVDDFVQWEGTLAEAEAWVISTNLHRRHLSAKQKQEMVRDRIRKAPEMSNRQIAKLLGVSHTMVADERERTLNPPDR